MKNYKNKNPNYASLHWNVVSEPSNLEYGAERKRCLYCYEFLPSRAEDYFHEACCKKFFGQAYVPQLDYSLSSLKELAVEFLQTSMSVTGVQAKVSVSWFANAQKNKVKKLTIVGLYGEYILKPPSEHYRCLPELEDCTMKMAAVCGLQTVPHTLFYLQDQTLCYLTKRVDRTKKGMRHMEDMCQLTQRLTEYKYKGSHEQVAKTLMQYSSAPLLDVGNFYEYVLFSFFTGNADMHLKNFSLLETNEKGKYMLSPAYDLLNTTLVNPSDTEELALTLNGKKSKLVYADFLAAYTNSGLTKKLLDKTLDNFYYCQLEMMEVLNKSFLPADLKQAYQLMLTKRLNRLCKH
jgi:serine/threonine-protein kinase HipA